MTAGGSSSPGRHKIKKMSPLASANVEEIPKHLSASGAVSETKRLPVSPSPEEDDSLSAREEESAWSCDRPSIRGMESSEDGTEES